MSPAEFAVKLNQGEAQLARLKRAYELWFRGVEDGEPVALRKEFEVMMTAMRQIRPPANAHRQRFDNLVHRFNSLRNLWRRQSRNKEEGR